MESRNGVSDGHRLKEVLAENESFETDFIGASEQDCREWALEKQFLVNWIEQDIIAIADKRSASDGTLSIQNYTWETLPDLDDPKILEPIPREEYKWFNFRVHYTEAFRAYASLSHTAQGIVRPTFFDRKDEFTDEQGVFSVAQVEELWKTSSIC